MKPMNLHKQSATVVVVNDDVTQLNLFSRLLRKEGIETMSFLDAETALRVMAQSLPPDLIITDLYMQGLDGWRFCRLLRSPEYQAFNKSPILVVSSTFAGEEATRITTDLGANAFLTSPIDAGVFIEHVRTLLSGERSQHQPRVLIVEDSKTLTGILKRVLDNHGYRVETVLTVTAAVAAFGKSAWDVAVIDYHLPDGEGDSLLNDFRAQQPDCVCIMMTTDPAPDLALSWMKKGAAAYLRKPFAPEYLIELCVKTRRERALLRVQDLLEMRTQELQESEAKFRKEQKFNQLLLDTSSAFIVAIGFDGKTIMMNRVLLVALEYTAEEIKGTDYLTTFVPEEDRARLARLFQEIVQEGKANVNENRIISRSGRTYLVEWHFRPVLKDESDIDIFVGVGIDIVDRKQAEEEKRSLEERLNRAEKMQALGTLAGGVAHDLNNVLGVIVGYAELLLGSVDESSPLRHRLENIMSGGLKAAAIVDDLLTLARRGVPGRSILNLNKIIADCQKSPEFANLSFHHPFVKIKTEIDPDLLNISGSSIHLGKTLYNLISNASEAMAKGGSVTIKTANQYLDKPIQGYDQIREGDYVVLSVSDTGGGIHDADLNRIFEPFYTKKVMGRSGTGLGLAVVWGTVKDHHGYINVQSEEGKGSTFTLYFPVTREDITVEHVALPVSKYMGQGESILVVDDVKEQRDLAAGMLMTLNYRIAGVSSGEDAVMYMKDHKVDLIIMDMIMDPGMDGLDTYKSILEIHPKQKAIIVSGFSESDRVRTAKDLGAGAYVRKPYIKEKLGLAVRQELDRST